MIALKHYMCAFFSPSIINTESAVCSHSLHPPPSPHVDKARKRIIVLSFFVGWFVISGRCLWAFPADTFFAMVIVSSVRISTRLFTTVKLKKLVFTAKRIDVYNITNAQNVRFRSVMIESMKHVQSEHWPPLNAGECHSDLVHVKGVSRHA